MSGGTNSSLGGITPAKLRRQPCALQISEPARSAIPTWRPVIAAPQAFAAADTIVSMTPDQLAIGQTITLAQTDRFRSTVTRRSAELLDAVYYDQSTNDETLRLVLHVDGSAELVAFDRVYWKVDVDGRPATERDIEDILKKRNLAFNVNAERRELSFFSNR
jgi:hypothetical protein